MLAWHVACNSIVTYSNYARCRSVAMETVARGDAIELWRCDRASRCDRVRLRRCEPSSGLSSVITDINTSGTSTVPCPSRDHTVTREST